MEKKIITKEMRDALRAPLPAAAVTKNPTKTYLSVIKPIYVIERLNDVFGIGVWRVKTDLVTPISSETKESNNRKRVEFTSLMKTILEIPDYGVYYECIAGSTNEDEGDSAKGGTTDGLTKIASWMEIGIEVFKGNGNVQAPATKPTPAQQTQQTVTVQHGQDAPEQVNPDTGEVIPYASQKQKDEIINLLNNKVIERAEKTKMLLNINKISEEKAAAAIEKLKVVIKDREAAAV